MRRVPAVVMLLFSLAAAGCSQQPEDYSYAPPLTSSTARREMTIARHSAAPVMISSTTVLVARGDSRESTCIRCHDGSKSRPPKGAGHPDTVLRHAAGMECEDCHMPGQPERLQTLAGTVGLHEQALRCRECHRNQVGDWLGGSHGKRLSGWAETRVIANCARCHDPHAPSLAPRLPVATPVIVPERTGPTETHHVEH